MRGKFRLSYFVLVLLFSAILFASFASAESCCLAEGDNYCTLQEKQTCCGIDTSCIAAYDEVAAGGGGCTPSLCYGRGVCVTNESCEISNTAISCTISGGHFEDTTTDIASISECNNVCCVYGSLDNDPLAPESNYCKYLQSSACGQNTPPNSALLTVKPISSQECTAKPGDAMLGPCNPYAIFPPASLTGHVREGASQPILGSQVSILNKKITVDTQGVYTINGLPTGKFSIIVSAVGYLENSSYVDLKTGANIADFGLIKIKNGAIKALIKDESGNPLSGANIFIYQSGTYIESASLEQSSEKDFFLPAGTYVVRAIKNNIYFQNNSVVVKQDVTTDVALVLKSPSFGKISGTVKDKLGNSLSGAEVSIGENSTATGADGKYELTVPVGTYNLVSKAAGYSTKVISDIQIASTPITQEVIMAKTLAACTSTCDQVGTRCSDEVTKEICSANITTGCLELKTVPCAAGETCAYGKCVACASTCTLNNVCDAICEGKNGCNFYDAIARSNCHTKFPGAYFPDPNDASKTRQCCEGKPAANPEDCANNKDDDLDGAVDCLDTNCDKMLCGINNICSSGKCRQTATYNVCEDANTAAGLICGNTLTAADKLFCCKNDNAVFVSKSECEKSPSCIPSAQQPITSTQCCSNPSTCSPDASQCTQAQASHIKGVKAVNLTWKVPQATTRLESYCIIKNYGVSSSLFGCFPTPTTEVIDSGVSWNGQYTYTIITKYKLSTAEGAVNIIEGKPSTATITLGDQMCESHKDEFCSDGAKRAKCNEENKFIPIEDCGAMSLRVAGTYSCIGPDKYDKTQCKVRDNCEVTGLPFENPFAMFNIKDKCYTKTTQIQGESLTSSRECYIDSSSTTVDRCYGCIDKNCYDYLSESACSEDRCSFANSSRCTWQASQPPYDEFGKGICYKENYKGTDYCGLCNANNSIFKNTECDQGTCSLLGRCIAAQDYKSCNACDVKSCPEYKTSESCIGASQITTDQCGAITPGKDACGLGTCKWNFQFNICYKDGNANSENDCKGKENDPNCQSDNVAPETTLLNPNETITPSKRIKFRTSENIKSISFAIEGVKGCDYDAVNFTSATSEFEIPVATIFKLYGSIKTSDGYYTLKYYSTDVNDNQESAKKTTFLFQTHNPNMTIRLKTPTMITSPTAYVNVSEESGCKYKLIDAASAIAQEGNFLNMPPFEVQGFSKFNNITLLTSPKGKYQLLINCTTFAGKSQEAMRDLEILAPKVDKVFYQNGSIVEIKLILEQSGSTLTPDFSKIDTNTANLQNYQVIDNKGNYSILYRISDDNALKTGKYPISIAINGETGKVADAMASYHDNNWNFDDDVTLGAVACYTKSALGRKEIFSSEPSCSWADVNFVSAKIAKLSSERKSESMVDWKHIINCSVTDESQSYIYKCRNTRANDSGLIEWDDPFNNVGYMPIAGVGHLYFNYYATSPGKLKVRIFTKADAGAVSLKINPYYAVSASDFTVSQFKGSEEYQSSASQFLGIVKSNFAGGTIDEVFILPIPGGKTGGQKFQFTYSYKSGGLPYAKTIDVDYEITSDSKKAITTNGNLAEGFNDAYCLDTYDNDLNSAQQYSLDYGAAKWSIADCKDPTCNGKAKCEYGTELSCTDGFDNDGDGYSYGLMMGAKAITPNAYPFSDCFDADCFGKPASGCTDKENYNAVGAINDSQCSDGINNDADYGQFNVESDNNKWSLQSIYGKSEYGALTDCNDLDCKGVAAGPTGQKCELWKELSCKDGFDNDGDNAVDCADYDCAGKDGCPKLENKKADEITEAPEQCYDTFDNDLDRYAVGSLLSTWNGRNQGNTDLKTIDCGDQDCDKLPGTEDGKKCEFGAEISCNDAFDNDGDNFVDCYDAVDCKGGGSGQNCGPCYANEAYSIASCADGIDNDFDGKKDCSDSPDCDGKMGPNGEICPELPVCLIEGGITDCSNPSTCGQDPTCKDSKSNPYYCELYGSSIGTYSCAYRLENGGLDTAYTTPSGITVSYPRIAKKGTFTMVFSASSLTASFTDFQILIGNSGTPISKLAGDAPKAVLRQPTTYRVDEITPNGIKIKGSGVLGKLYLDVTIPETIAENTKYALQISAQHSASGAQQQAPTYTYLAESTPPTITSIVKVKDRLIVVASDDSGIAYCEFTDGTTTLPKSYDCKVTLAKGKRNIGIKVYDNVGNIFTTTAEVDPKPQPGAQDAVVSGSDSYPSKKLYKPEEMLHVEIPFKSDSGFNPTDCMISVYNETKNLVKSYTQKLSDIKPAEGVCKKDIELLLSDLGNNSNYYFIASVVAGNSETAASKKYVFSMCNWRKDPDLGYVCRDECQQIPLGLNITYPFDNFATDKSLTIVNGTTEKGAEVKIYVKNKYYPGSNGRLFEVLTAKEDGTFNATVVLANGTNEIIIFAKNPKNDGSAMVKGMFTNNGPTSENITLNSKPLDDVVIVDSLATLESAVKNEGNGISAESSKIKITDQNMKEITSQTEASTADPKNSLIGIPLKGSLNDGETKTYTGNGKEFEVAASAIAKAADGKPIATLTVNAQTINSLKENQPFTLIDGSILNITKITDSGIAKKVEFTIAPRLSSTDAKNLLLDWAPTESVKPGLYTADIMPADSDGTEGEFRRMKFIVDPNAPKAEMSNCAGISTNSYQIPFTGAVDKPAALVKPKILMKGTYKGQPKEEYIDVNPANINVTNTVDWDDGMIKFYLTTEKFGFPAVLTSCSIRMDRMGPVVLGADVRIE